MMQSIHKIYVLLIFSMILTAPSSMKSQVTIGSDITPLPGLLLDLKQEASTGEGVTSNRGLLLPRVKLEKPNTLMPVADVLTDTANYTGIVVYNVADNIEQCHLMNPGLYTWNGSEWAAWSSGLDQGKYAWKENSDGKTGILTDYDGNDYSAKKIGDLWWMTENMIVTRTRDGQSLYDPDDTFADYGARLNPAVNSNITFGSIEIKCLYQLLSTDTPIEYLESEIEPGISDGPNKSDSRLTYAKKFGLGYTFRQAELVCPTGWRLPSEADWLNLVKAIDPSGTLDNNVAGASMRANNNWYKAIGPGEFPFQWGVNDPANTVQSGFNGYPSGLVQHDGTLVGNFGYMAYWWGADEGANAYTLQMSLSKLGKISINRYYYFNIRCVKD